jgi:hypothetical protein
MSVATPERERLTDMSAFERELGEDAFKHLWWTFLGGSVCGALADRREHTCEPVRWNGQLTCPHCGAPICPDCLAVVRDLGEWVT